MTEIDILEKMLLSRFFEQKVEKLFKDGVFYGTTHLNIGQEASHTGLAAALDDKDWIVPTHRCHGFNVARGSNIRKMFSELFGSKDGLCKGLGGSMHMSDVSTCNAGSSAIVGSSVPLATGIAFALDKKGKDSIAVAIFGDGATSRGAVHESMNIASVWNIPVLFYLENNHYGMSASSSRMLSTSDMRKRADAYSMRYFRADGNDVLDVIEKVKSAREYILAARKPAFVEVETYRLCGHSKSDRCIYRSREEEEEWRKKDPISRYEKYLVENNFASDEDISLLRANVRAEVDKAYMDAYRMRGLSLSLKEAEDLVFSPSAVQDCQSGKTHSSTYRNAIYEALDEILSEDNDAYLIGEDIGLYGGCFAVTRDLYSRHPGKVLETPVSEEGFTSLAVGAAMMNLHPIVEIMYADFSTLASDSLINHAAKTYFMSAGQLSVPLVYRAPIGSGTGHGSQHTANIEAMFLNTPGLIVVAPSDPFSAKALLKSAVRENNPVLFFEHKGLYDTEGQAGDANTFLPLKKAFVSGCGKDMLLISYSHAYQTSLEATQSFSDRITYIDLATISPLDEETIIREAGKFEKIMIVQDTPFSGSVGATVAAMISRHFAGKRIEIVSALDMPIPFAKSLENAVVPVKERVRIKAASLLSAL